jgi:superfamily II DNA/RNA helicase
VSSRDFAIEAIRQVINVDMPHDMDKYVHQIGRRNAISFFDPTSKSDRKLARPLVRLLAEAQ